MRVYVWLSALAALGGCAKGSPLGGSEALSPDSVDGASDDGSSDSDEEGGDADMGSPDEPDPDEDKEEDESFMGAQNIQSVISLLLTVQLRKYVPVAGFWLNGKIAIEV